VLTDAAQGGTGLLKGSEGEGVVELMVHRRLLNDDQAPKATLPHPMVYKSLGFSPLLVKVGSSSNL